MTILVYLGHPAHFHLFKETIKQLQAKAVKVVIVIKSKDVLEKLLIDSKLPYLNISDANNKGSAIKNFTKRLYNLSKIIRAEKPLLLAGSAAELAILGKLYRIPSYIFFEDDFEAVKKFAKIAGPFATKLICPNCCSAWKWDNKKLGYNSYHELAYLHPNHFTPDAEKVKHIFNLNQKNYILRFAQLTAYHDVGKSGITTEIAQKLIDMLSAKGNVFITSERALEPQFEKYRIQISPLDIHHALYFADMYIGDSQTMTAEAAVLGTPAIRFNLLSNKSPNVPAIAAMPAIIPALTTEILFVKYAMRQITIMVRMIPPIVPSQVFFGEIFDNGVLPIIDPTMYAIVSLIHREKIISSGIV